MRIKVRIIAEVNAEMGYITNGIDADLRAAVAEVLNRQEGYRCGAVLIDVAPDDGSPDRGDDVQGLTEEFDLIDDGIRDLEYDEHQDNMLKRRLYEVCEDLPVNARRGRVVTTESELGYKLYIPGCACKACELYKDGERDIEVLLPLVGVVGNLRL